MKTLPSDIESIVFQEVASSYDHDEMLSFKNFSEFWDQIDTQNAYEEEWKEWKRKGIKSVYKSVYYKYKKAVS